MRRPLWLNADASPIGGDAACQRRDGTGASPTWSLGDAVEAKRRLHLRKRLGRDQVPAELCTGYLGACVGCTGVQPLQCPDCGPKGHTHVIKWWENWKLQSILCQCRTLFKRYDKLLWTAVPRGTSPLVPL